MVAGLAVVALMPVFIGLPVMFPVLGHAIWHLCRRVVRNT